ncbi:MAG: hypothetical protein DRJ65_00230 [Acidobacteria bacterium]|nr:MAG: hypothetical protein DRJ65_00230 [Acidobacteriota bacterium]
MKSQRADRCAPLGSSIQLAPAEVSVAGFSKPGVGRVVDACIAGAVIIGILVVWLAVSNVVTPQAADLGLKLEEVSILLVTNQRDIAPIAAYVVVSPEQAEILRETTGSWGVLVDRKQDWR